MLGSDAGRSTLRHCCRLWFRTLSECVAFWCWRGTGAANCPSARSRAAIRCQSARGRVISLISAAPMAQLGERAAALDAGKVAVVVGEDHLPLDPERFRQLLAASGIPAESVAACA